MLCAAVKRQKTGKKKKKKVDMIDGIQTDTHWLSTLAGSQEAASEGGDQGPTVISECGNLLGPELQLLGR